MIYLESRDYIKLRGNIATLREDLKKIEDWLKESKIGYRWSDNSVRCQFREGTTDMPLGIYLDISDSDLLALKLKFYR